MPSPRLPTQAKQALPFSFKANKHHELSFGPTKIADNMQDTMASLILSPYYYTSSGERTSLHLLPQMGKPNLNAEAQAV